MLHADNIVRVRARLRARKEKPALRIHLTATLRSDRGERLDGPE
jgi:hypothetical protein